MIDFVTRHEAPSTTMAGDYPVVIQGGMGVGVSSWQLARTVAKAGGVGVISGVAPDLVLARWLQDGDPTGAVREALADFPDTDLVERVLHKFFRDGGRAKGTPYRPIPKLDMHQKRDAVQLTALGAYAQVRMAKRGHDGAVGINLLEKVQLWTPAALLGAMIAEVDYVLIGAGVPAHIPRVLTGLSTGQPVSLPIDVAGALSGERYEIALDPTAIFPMATSLKRPFFLAIISSHVLGQYLARDEVTRPDGFVVEGPTAGGHNAPPRKVELDDDGQPIYGARDVVDLDKLAATGLPFWLAGGYATPEKVAEAIAMGAVGVQIGTAFALSDESGLTAPIRRTLRERLRADTLDVRTDPLASPTGFPFKVVQLSGTTADPPVYAERKRICDLGYLRTPYRRDDGAVGYRCASEPVDEYVRKGGSVDETVGRICLCNGLMATHGQAQIRGESIEPPLTTLGADRAQLAGLFDRFAEGWSALDVMAWVTSALEPRLRALVAVPQLV